MNDLRARAEALGHMIADQAVPAAREIPEGVLSARYSSATSFVVDLRSPAWSVAK